MKKNRTSVLIVSFVALFTMISPYVADWNETHIYNDNWPPHAKFHNAQTMLLGLLLGISALWYLWKPVTDTPGQKINFNVALFLAAAYWITQSLSILFPGTAFIDPQFGSEVPRLLGLPVQLTVDIIVFILMAIAYYMEQKTYRQLNRPRLV